jgi:hypothetical protein
MVGRVDAYIFAGGVPESRMPGFSGIRVVNENFSTLAGVRKFDIFGRFLPMQDNDA